MRKLVFLLLAFAFLAATHAATIPATALLPGRPSEEPLPNANQLMVSINNSGASISLMSLSRISVKEFQKLRGKKLSLFEKISFKINQKRLRNQLAADGTVKSTAVSNSASQLANGNSGFHAGGFALGFFLSLLGVLVAYVVPGENKSARVKWAWIGAASFLLVIVVLAAALGGFYSGH